MSSPMTSRAPSDIAAEFPGCHPSIAEVPMLIEEAASRSSRGRGIGSRSSSSHSICCSTEVDEDMDVTEETDVTDEGSAKLSTTDMDATEDSPPTFQSLFHCRTCCCSSACGVEDSSPSVPCTRVILCT
eukprot:11487621-Heterocapsa_arctica.AAC.1